MSDNEALIMLKNEGSESARDKLIENNMGLVRSIAKRFLGRGYDYEELCQIGSVGLIKAVDRFSTDFGVQLSTYAVPVIMGEIKRFLRDDGPVKVARSLKELATQAMAEKERLEKELEREVTVSELSASLGVENERLVLALGAAFPTRSLYESSSDEDDGPLIDKIAFEPSDEEGVIMRLALKNALSRLSGKERSVIIMRYFRSMTQTAVSNLLGVSQVQVSRIESRAKEKIRHEMM